MLRLARQGPSVLRNPQLSQLSFFCSISAGLHSYQGGHLLPRNGLNSLLRSIFFQPDSPTARFTDTFLVFFLFALPCSSLSILSPELLNLAELHGLLFLRFYAAPLAVQGWHL